MFERWNRTLIFPTAFFMRFHNQIYLRTGRQIEWVEKIDAKNFLWIHFSVTEENKISDAFRIDPIKEDVNVAYRVKQHSNFQHCKWLCHLINASTMLIFLFDLPFTSSVLLLLLLLYDDVFFRARCSNCKHTICKWAYRFCSEFVCSWFTAGSVYSVGAFERSNFHIKTCPRYLYI